MKYSSANRGFPAGNPLANIFVIIVGTLAIGASVILGFFAFVIVASVLLIMAAVVGLRVWWFNRRMSRRPPGGQQHKSTPGGVIEGEYKVVADERKDA